MPSGGEITVRTCYEAATAERLAEGDLTARVTAQSSGDVLGAAFTRMLAHWQQ